MPRNATTAAAADTASTAADVVAATSTRAYTRAKWRLSRERVARADGRLEGKGEEGAPDEAKCESEDHPLARRPHLHGRDVVGGAAVHHAQGAHKPALS